MASKPSKVWLLVSISIRAWTAWHGQQAFKLWLLARISILALTMWHGQKACRVWRWVRVLIKAWTTWHGVSSWQCGPGGYVSWCLAILLWCVEKSNVCWRWPANLAVSWQASAPKPQNQTDDFSRSWTEWLLSSFWDLFFWLDLFYMLPGKICLSQNGLDWNHRFATLLRLYTLLVLQQLRWW